MAFCHNPSNLDHWIAQLQGICGDQQLPRVLRGWCIAQYFPFFWNNDCWLMIWKPATILRGAGQPEVDFLHSWATILNKFLGKSSLQQKRLLAIQIWKRQGILKRIRFSSGLRASFKNVVAYKLSIFRCFTKESIFGYTIGIIYEVPVVLWVSPLTRNLEQPSRRHTRRWRFACFVEADLLPANCF